MKPQTEEQWLMVLAVIERLYAEVRAGNWDGLRQMLHGYTTPASVSPEPDEKARLMEYAVAAGDCIVAGVPQWRDGWAIISRIQTDPPNERWMLHDADEREKESRAEAVQLALVNTGMDFAVVPIKWRTPTKECEHDWIGGESGEVIRCRRCEARKPLNGRDAQS